jgi:hypothetical protein
MKTEVITCDRCFTQCGSSRAYIAVERHGTSYKNMHRDLCDSCYADLMEYLSKPKQRVEQ